jgi:hypothetical protein
MLSRKEFSAWLENPVTIRILDLLKREREDLNECLLNAVPDHQSKENCLMVMGKLIGRINAIDQVLSSNYECIQTEEEAEAEAENNE